jgi:hypothetical protein
MTAFRLFPFIILGIVSPIVQALPSTESLFLKSDLGPQDISSGFVTDQDGTTYSLSELMPYTELVTDFVLEPRSGEPSFLMPIYRGTFADGATLQLQKDQAGNIVYVEIRNIKGKPDTYLVKTEDSRDGELLAYRESDVDSEMIRNEFDLDEVHLQIDYPGKESVRDSQETLTDRADSVPAFVYTRGDGTSAECTYFKVVQVGVVFDSDFCKKYGSAVEARGRIMMIVASASIVYEKDMCVKLRLTDIYTPDQNCLASTSVFSSFPRGTACGNSPTTFIKSFRSWMNRNRDSLGLNPNAIFHVFTGYQPQGTLGCGFVGVYCRFPEHSYGVDYMISDNLQTQSTIFAHEIGHNLNAPHIPATNLRYMMEPALNVPNDGFDQSSIDTILTFLDGVTCDETERAAPVQPPSRRPTKRPTIRPAKAPVPAPIRSVPTPPVACSVQQSDRFPLCVVESSSSNKYVCYTVADITSVRPTSSCNLSNPFIVTTLPIACNVIQDASSDSGGGRRELKKGKDGGRDRFTVAPSAARSSTVGTAIPSISPPNYAEDYNIILEGDCDKSGMVEEDALNSISSDNTLTSFPSENCSAGCTITGNHVCFLATLDDSEVERVYRLTFSATSPVGTVIFSKEVAVEKNTAQFAFCDVAVSSCT